MRRPDPLYAAVADRSGLGHHPASPVRRLARWGGERHLHDPFDRGRGQGRLATGPGGVPQEAVHAHIDKAPLPSPDRRLSLAGAALDLHRADPVGAQQHDTRSPDILLWSVPGTDDGLKPITISGTKADFKAVPHSGSFAWPCVERNFSLAPIH